MCMFAGVVHMSYDGEICTPGVGMIHWRKNDSLGLDIAIAVY